MDKDILEKLYSKEEIQKVCKRLGKQLSEDYKDKNPLVIIVLRGALLFGSDLIREMNIKMSIDFITISSYIGGKSSTNNIKLLKDACDKVTNRNVIIIDDIIDTGQSIKFLKKLINSRHPKSVKSCLLLDKPSRRIVEEHGDYVGIKIPNKFVVGYGMDYGGEYRNLPYIGVLKPAVYSYKSNNLSSKSSKSNNLDPSSLL